MDDSRRLLSRRAVFVTAGSAVGSLTLGGWAEAQDRTTSRPIPRLEPLFEMVGDLQKPLEVGSTPVGERRIFVVTAGTFTGPMLRGTVLPRRRLAGAQA